MPKSNAESGGVILILLRTIIQRIIRRQLETCKTFDAGGSSNDQAA
jgi:hypothetical protein